jgi:hypothetical protein
MEKTVVSAGVTRHTTDLLDLKQQYIIITIKANLMHFLEVTGLLTLVP